MGRLAGKTAIITGAARGIGAATARLFAREGASLVLADRDAGALATLCASMGPDADAMAADVAEEADVIALVERAVIRRGRLDVAVLNAGISGQPRRLVDTPAEMFDSVMSVNARGVFLGLKASMRAMATTGGSIIVVASAASIRATPNMSAYIASKHAALGLMRAAAIEGAAQGIRVNSVHPATIDTPMVRALDAAAAARGETRTQAAHIPMRRVGTAEEVARLNLFLASDEASFCTGGAHMVDGGVSAGRAG